MPESRLPVFGATDDLLMGIMRRFFADHPEIHIGTLFSDDLVPPVIIARRSKASGESALETKVDRFIQTAICNITTITSGVDADEQADELQEACRLAMRTAQQEQWTFPDAGTLSIIKNSSPAARVSDWATSSSAVQYASLPKNWVRSESIWRVLVRPPQQSTITNRFVTPAP
jgi:hypothetical protein